MTLLPQVALALVLSQYVRSRVDDRDPKSQCLWWHEDTTITLRQHVDGNAETPGDTEFTAVARSIATWQTRFAACGSLTLKEGPRTQSRTVGYTETGENENLALFRQRLCSDAAPAGHACHDEQTCGNLFDCWQHQDTAIAITTTSFNPSTGRILDSDIEFNRPNFFFTTVDSPPCVRPVINSSCVAADVENTATHELGHLLGLGHINVAGSTMASSASIGETTKRTLDPGTAQFVCDVYPKGKLAKSCVLPVADEELGEFARGCHCGGGAGGLWLLGALVLLRRSRW